MSSEKPVGGAAPRSSFTKYDLQCRALDHAMLDLMQKVSETLPLAMANECPPEKRQAVLFELHEAAKAVPWPPDVIHNAPPDAVGAMYQVFDAVSQWAIALQASMGGPLGFFSESATLYLPANQQINFWMSRGRSLRESFFALRQRFAGCGASGPADSRREPLADGAHDGDILVWKGKPYFNLLSHKEWRLVRSMWKRDTCPADVLAEEVWEEHSAPLKATLGSLVHRTNDALSEIADFPWLLSVKSGAVVKDFKG